MTTVDEPGTWVFTFGSGQRAYAIGRYDRDKDKPLDQDARIRPEGFRLDDRYVVFRDMTHADARGHMVHYFGAVWSGEYESLEAAGVEKYGLTELVITEDWQAPEGDEW